MHRRPFPADLLIGQVDLQLANGDHRRGTLRRGLRRAGAAQRRRDPGQQFLDAERLGQVVVRSHVERGHLVPLAAARGHHDDGD